MLFLEINDLTEYKLYYSRLLGEAEPVGHVERDLLWGIDAHGDGGWQVPQSASWRPKEAGEPKGPMV